MTAPSERQVVILAGGLGTRLRGLGGDLPKALRPVAGRPFVDLLVEGLARQGFQRFHFCLGHRGAQIARHLGELAMPVEVSCEIETTRRGTAGALLCSAESLDDVFLMTMGDTYLDFPCGSLFDELREDAAGVLVVSDADSSVVPNVGLEGSLVTAYDKRGLPGGWTDTGFAVLRRVALDPLRGAADRVDLTALYRDLIGRRSLRAARTERRFYDIGTPSGYRALDRHLRAPAGGGLSRC